MVMAERWILFFYSIPYLIDLVIGIFCTTLFTQVYEEEQKRNEIIPFDGENAEVLPFVEGRLKNHDNKKNSK
jgi:hypothetical protein